LKNLFRRNPSGSTRRKFLKGAGALGLTLTVGAGRARGEAASVVVIDEDGSVSTSANTGSIVQPAIGAATFIASTSYVASSLETGNMVYVTAWGGSEYGYAYHYALSGAPTGVTIDSDMGIIAIGTALAVGDYSFTVTATNRENTSLSASFPFTLHILQGITSGTPTASQILHKTYDPHSGTWGTPTGNDWTNVFNTMATAIISDQTAANAAGDERLRVTIPLHRGVVYTYQNNDWLNGIQYFQLIDMGSGALPVLRCIRNDPGGGDFYGDGPLNLGGGGGGRTGPGSIGHQEGVKARCAPIATVAAGSTTVTLLAPGDAGKIKVGRWHQVLGWVIQVGGYPPNEQFIDYVKVVSVSGTTVTLDRPLRHGYDQTWWEEPNDDLSLGVARLCPYDTGGAGGYIPGDRRIFIRARVLNMDLQGNPNYPGGPNTDGANIAYMAGAIDFTFEGCNIPNAQLSMCKHIALKNVTATWAWELDKESETLLIDGGTTATYVIQAATGFDYVLFRNHHAGLIQISPRQLRSKGTHHDGTGDGGPGVGAAYGPPITLAFQGPLGFFEFGMDGACQFTHGLDNRWMYPASPDVSLNLGTDATWSGNRLQIPSSFRNFENWLNYTAPGTIVSSNALPPYTTNWGYVASASSPGDGSALWYNITWVNGTKPTSGTLYLRRLRRLYFAQANTFNAGTFWASPGGTKETAPSRETGWDAPAGYPPRFAG
jgi:hypothetical protein